MVAWWYKAFKVFRHQEVDHATHRHVLVLTQVQLGVDGSVCHVWETNEELGDELSRQALLLGATFDAIQDHLVGVFVLQKKT